MKLKKWGIVGILLIFTVAAFAAIYPSTRTSYPKTFGKYGMAEVRHCLKYVTETMARKTLTAPTLTSVDIDSGTVSYVTIAGSDITVGAGKTLDVSAGTLTLADNQISGDNVEGGTIAATTITTLTSTTVNGTTVNSTTVNGTTFDTNVAAAAVTLTGTTLEADGTDSNIDINITPKGTGVVTYSGRLDAADDGGATLGYVAAGGVTGIGMSSANVVDAMNKTTITFDSLAVVITDAGAAGAHGSVKIHDFPEGFLQYFGSVLNLSLAAAYGGIADDATEDVGIGTVTTATDNEELSTTEQDLVNKVEGDFAGGLKTINGYNAMMASFDGHTGAKDAFLNFAIAADDCSANDTMWVSGTATLFWLNLGDY